MCRQGEDEVSTKRLKVMVAEEVAQASVEGAVLLDFRDLEDFAASRIPGAVFICFNARSVPKHVSTVALPGSSIVLIGNRDRVEKIQAWFESVDSYNVIGWFEGDMGTWTAAGKSIESLRSLSVEGLHQRWYDDRKSFELIDVREPFEWNLGTIEGSRLVSLGDVHETMDVLKRDQELIFICEQGVRSATAATLFSRQGFQNTANVAKGFGAWFDAGFPIVE